MAPRAGQELVPFIIRVPGSALADLRERLAKTRWAPEPDGAADAYGVPRARVQQLAEHWRDAYDWRVWEERLNRYPQFTTTIDGTRVHFLHVRSPEPHALPLICTHGWPGSVAEFLDVIGPLTDPRAHGLSPEVAFHLVIPALPGFAWSGPTPDTGWGPRRIARAWATLMRRLGYRRYGAAGNDWGSHISPELGRIAPEAVAGVHVTQLFSLPEGEWLSYPPSVEPDLGELTPDDRAALDGLRHLQRHSGSYAHVHGRQPHTLAFALTDSPVGLLAWNSQAMGDLDADTLLTHVTIYWLTGTAASAMRIYAEYERQPPAAGPTTTPLALAQFPHDIQAIRVCAQRDHAAIVSWNTYDRGGHYAAHQAPDLLVHDLRAFFANLIPGRPGTAG
ncbi:epoxide hydrolase [Nonomuraea sp. FMUSA5-5]|uniref:Epoxide hydrolase n=1 Tax=Nonomuraea composti TaxID=2720023 RepID=A0ABX1BCP8_9ACTN|nr:epoxide hydrolase [Nonomuraea sp. FMUSA5-5]